MFIPTIIINSKPILKLLPKMITRAINAIRLFDHTIVEIRSIQSTITVKIYAQKSNRKN